LHGGEPDRLEDRQQGVGVTGLGPALEQARRPWHSRTGAQGPDGGLVEWQPNQLTAGSSR
jgi:hypothetical protein